MSFNINLQKDFIKYSFEDEEYSTGNLFSIDSKVSHAKGDYKNPDDVIIEEKYQAESEHGDFLITVIARWSGYALDGDIDSFTIEEPIECEILESPEFNAILED